MAYRQPGSAADEQIIRRQSLDEMAPPASGLNMNYQRRFSDASIGTLLGYMVQYGTAVTYNNGGGITTATTTATWTSGTTTTLAAVNSAAINVSFTATTAQVIVKIKAAYVDAAAGTSGLVLALFNHGLTTQVGFHTNARIIGVATVNADPAPMYAEILVTGLTPGTSYEWDLAWAPLGSSAYTISTGGATSGVVSTNDFGALSMEVLAA
jgi:hypothetical protein